MSRIGKMPIAVPQGVEVKFENNVCIVSKGNQKLSQAIDPRISVEEKDGHLELSRQSDEKEIRALHGLYRALIHNMIVGLDQGFSKTLKIEGVGYKADLKGTDLVLTVGLSHTVEMPAPEGITFELTKPTEIVIKGADKQMVGETAAKIRAVRPPEPYKGKGIRYADEVVRLKEGKTGA
ncbi:MAG: 50S ribosomal protein L6 [Eubacteriales bacterium]|nr:50S ribosomal protein L6 [Eubacteriales bacterium]